MWLARNRFEHWLLSYVQVAECCLEALVEPAASNKVVEIISKKDAEMIPYSGLFEKC